MGFLNKNMRVSCHFLLQGIFVTQGSKLHLLWILQCKWILYHWATREACFYCSHHLQNSKTFRKSEFNFKNHELTASKSSSPFITLLVLCSFGLCHWDDAKSGKIILNAAALFKCVKVLWKKWKFIKIKENMSLTPGRRKTISCNINQYGTMSG